MVEQQGSMRVYYEITVTKKYNYRKGWRKMKYIDRNGNIEEVSTSQDQLLEKLYTSSLGRAFIKPFTSPVFSRILGALLNTRLSSCLIVPFVKTHNIQMDDYKSTFYQSYNEFFSREIKPEKRPIDSEIASIISPADGKLSVYPISDDLHIRIKHTTYSIASLLKSEQLASQYEGGYAVVVRLTVDNYHRYCYVADGQKGKNHYIKGILHTVNPIANDYVPIYKENAREFCRIRTKHFGEIIQMEVGAMMVGKITNYHHRKQVSKGEEKGKFEFGGSTVVLLVKKDMVDLDADLLENTQKGYETIVKMGERIGYRKAKEDSVKFFTL